LADYQSIHDFVHDLCTKDPLFKHFLSSTLYILGKDWRHRAIPR
jgi:hypothetical protein